MHAGHLIARRLKASGIDTVFTLSGGHLFWFYDGGRSEGIRLIDTRHEQTAAFAAEGWSKVTRVPGVAALTAGPGVTNGISAMAAAQQNLSPLVVLGGRAPALRWGQGSLQEIDHVPFVVPLARFAATATSAESAGMLVDQALRAAVASPSGVAFVDFPMDHVFSEAPDPGLPGALSDMPAGPSADVAALERAAELLAAAERPVIPTNEDINTPTEERHHNMAHQPIDDDNTDIAANADEALQVIGDYEFSGGGCNDDLRPSATGGRSP